jgi:hypothetical protein
MRCRGEACGRIDDVTSQEPAGPDDRHRRRRRRRATAPQGPPPEVAAAPEPAPEPAASGPAATASPPDGTGKRADKPRTPKRTPRDGATERGLRDLVGAGRSQVGVSGALRARDVNRPTEQDLAEAEAELVIVRRNWKPRPDA